MRFEPNMHTALWGTENWVCSLRAFRAGLFLTASDSWTSLLEGSQPLDSILLVCI